MRNIYFALLGASLTFGFSLQAGTFEIEENFDDASHFSNESLLPDGWACGSESFRRTSTADAAFPAKSGNYLFGAGSPSDGIFFTPLKEVAAGQPYKIEFSVALPGGNYDWWTLGLKVYASPAQDSEHLIELGTLDYQQIASWKDVSYSFTPDTDGEYCFAIRATRKPEASYASCGAAWFDDFFISGTEPGDTPVVMEPNEENLEHCVELPYSEDFTDPSHYVQYHNLPDWWSNTGTYTWRTANSDNLTAVQGQWYMVSPESNSERDERAYTPFFNLVAGREYNISFYTHFDGYIINGEPRTATIKFTVGTEQEVDFHPVTLASISRGLDQNPGWVRETVNFTPAVSGPYCFAFMLEGPAVSGWVAVDLFEIGSAYDLPRPKPVFSLGGNYNYSDNTLFAFGDQPVPAVNLSEYSDSYSWASGATLEELDNGDAAISFPSSGDYDITLSATNARGTRSISQSVSVTRLDGESPDILLLHYNPEAVTIIDRGHIPSYDTNENGLDYVSGFNHYYRTLAQRYELPAEGAVIPSKLILFMANLRYVPIGGPDAVYQDDLPFFFSIYGSDAQGEIDESKVLYRKETTMGEFFGHQFVGGSTAPPVFFDFDERPELSGTVYLTFEFSDQLKIDVEDPNIGRSFFSLQLVRASNPEATFYVKSGVALEDKGIGAGEWHRVNDYTPDNSGLGLSMILKADYRPSTDGVSTPTQTEDDFTATAQGGRLLLSGVKGHIALYGIDGRLLLEARTDESRYSLDITSLPAGVYVVATEGATVKFIK